jgi:Ca2+-binding EF-hand superfamily protein
LNRSGGRSRAELDKTPPSQFSTVKSNFAAMDPNKDGQLTLEERDNYRPGQQAVAVQDWRALLKKADLNDSGRLSKAELSKTAPADLADL